MLIPNARPRSERRRSWKALARVLAGNCYYYSGLFSLYLKWCQSRKHSVLILMFHRVLPANSPALTKHLALPPLITTQENLQALIRFLEKHFRFMGLPDYIRQLGKGDSPETPGCIFTFDDGYNDFAKYAWPTLRAKNIPATMYLPTALIGTTHCFWWDRLYHAAMNFQGVITEDVESEVMRLTKDIANTPQEDRPQHVYKLIELAQFWPLARIEAFIQRLGGREPGTADQLREANGLMDWTEVRMLHNSGVHFGSHTRHHFNLKTVTPAVLREEISVSKRELESSLKCEVTSFSFPGGHVPDEVLQDLNEAGYTDATTTRRGMARPEEGAFKLRRLNIWDGVLQDHRGHFSPGVFALNLTKANWS